MVDEPGHKYDKEKDKDKNIPCAPEAKVLSIESNEKYTGTT